ncbi:hypothetical protein LEM8419_01227 [Neolewinella maritima]|uniref:DUF4142 domain-containing protein n=1 Tax=Neolewinella maritima TaxID=1383882 RepID=A0ABM9AZZ9_9BACT|nr:hypothetical protein [Neolewinella maritima]CAH1000036.1 hypothetical protein LEM8419_01227 [Neolewinella maritima]
MAQIRIEEKKASGGSIWPWIIGLLLLGLIIWGVAEAFEESDEVLTEEVIEEDDTVAPVAAEVDEADYAEFMTAKEAFMATTANMEGEMGLDHEFSHQAITQLANAAAALAIAEGVADEANVDSKVSRAKKLADEITRDPMAGDHADKIKMASMLIVEIFEDVDRVNGNATSDAISNLRSEAQAMTAESLTLNQKENVRSFFGQAREVLSMMGS